MRMTRAPCTELGRERKDPAPKRETTGSEKIVQPHITGVKSGQMFKSAGVTHGQGQASVISETNCVARKNAEEAALTTVSCCWERLGLKPLLKVGTKPEVS